MKNTRYDCFDGKNRWMGGYDSRLTILDHPALRMAHDKARQIGGKVVKVTTEDGVGFEEEVGDYTR
jgi:hypothetical protein